MGRRLSGNGGGSLRAVTRTVLVSSVSGVVYTALASLKAPVAWVKASGSYNLSVNSSTGVISATAAIGAGVSQSIGLTATGADGCVQPFSLTLTGQATAPAPSLSLSSAVTLPEGNSGTTLFAWTLTLNRDGSTASYTYNYAVTGNGPNPADAADFGGWPSGSGTFAPGETSKTINILATGDTASEPNETFLLTVTAAGLNTVTSTGTIVDDDSGPTYPAADLFSFSDNPASGNTYIRDRTGWVQSTADVRSQILEQVTGGNLSFADGFSTAIFSGQDIGRTDGGFVSGAIASSASDYNLVVNQVDERNYIYVNLTSGRNRLRIFKIIAGASTTVYDTGVITALNVGDVLTLTYDWSGSTCTLTLLVNAVRYPNSSTSWTVAASGDLQPSSLVGARTTGLYSAYSSGMNGATAKPRITLDKVKRLYQRDKATGLGTVAISGIAKGITSIQFRLLQNGSVVSGWNYGDRALSGLTVNSSTGVYSASVGSIPTGTNYQLQVRDSVDQAAGSKSRMFEVGAFVMQRGQSLAVQGYEEAGNTPRTELTGVSNAWFPFSAAPNTEQRYNPFDFASEYDWSGTVPGGNTYLTNKTKAGFSNGFRANSALAIGWFSGGYGSSKLSTFLSSDSSVPYTAGPSRTRWTNLVAQTAWLGDFEMLVWDHGQENAGRVYNTNNFNSTDATAYKSDFISYVSAVRALVGRTAAQMPVIITPIGRMYPAGGVIGNYASDAAYDLFFKTQVELCSLIDNCFLGPMQSDLTLASTTTSEPHLSATDAMGYVEKELRIGYLAGKIINGSGSDRNGAKPLSMSHSGNTLTMTFDANGATALTCAQGIATNFSFWTDNTFATAMVPSSMSIGSVSGGQVTVTWTFSGPTATGNVVSSGKGGAYSIGGSYPDTANALKATQADGRGVITWPVSAAAQGYLAAA